MHRLLSRLLSLHAPPKAKQTLDILWAGASAFVNGATRPGDVNQALIELGSTVCKVRDPACSACSLQQWCAAYARAQNSRGEEGEDADSARKEVRQNEQFARSTASGREPIVMVWNLGRKLRIPQRCRG